MVSQQAQDIRSSYIVGVLGMCVGVAVVIAGGRFITETRTEWVCTGSAYRCLAIHNGPNVGTGWLLLVIGVGVFVASIYAPMRFRARQRAK